MSSEEPASGNEGGPTGDNVNGIGSDYYDPAEKHETSSSAADFRPIPAISGESLATGDVGDFVTDLNTTTDTSIEEMLIHDEDEYVEEILLDSGYFEEIVMENDDDEEYEEEIIEEDDDDEEYEEVSLEQSDPRLQIPETIPEESEEGLSESAGTDNDYDGGGGGESPMVVEEQPKLQPLPTIPQGEEEEEIIDQEQVDDVVTPSSTTDEEMDTASTSDAEAKTKEGEVDDTTPAAVPENNLREEREDDEPPTIIEDTPTEQPIPTSPAEVPKTTEQQESKPPPSPTLQDDDQPKETTVAAVVDDAPVADDEMAKVEKQSEEAEVPSPGDSSSNSVGAEAMAVGGEEQRRTEDTVEPEKTDENIAEPSAEEHKEEREVQSAVAIEETPDTVESSEAPLLTERKIDDEPMEEYMLQNANEGKDTESSPSEVAGATKMEVEDRPKETAAAVVDSPVEDEKMATKVVEQSGEEEVSSPKEDSSSTSSEDSSSTSSGDSSSHSSDSGGAEAMAVEVEEKEQLRIEDTTESEKTAESLAEELREEGEVRPAETSEETPDTEEISDAALLVEAEPKPMEEDASQNADKGKETESSLSEEAALYSEEIKETSTTDTEEFSDAALLVEAEPKPMEEDVSQNADKGKESESSLSEEAALYSEEIKETSTTDTEEFSDAALLVEAEPKPMEEDASPNAHKIKETESSLLEEAALYSEEVKPDTSAPLKGGKTPQPEPDGTIEETSAAEESPGAHIGLKADTGGEEGEVKPETSAPMDVGETSESPQSVPDGEDAETTPVMENTDAPTDLEAATEGEEVVVIPEVGTPMDVEDGGEVPQPVPDGEEQSEPEPEAAAEEPADAMEEEPPAKQSSWFGGWFGGKSSTPAQTDLEAEADAAEAQEEGEAKEEEEEAKPEISEPTEEKGNQDVKQEAKLMEDKAEARRQKEAEIERLIKEVAQAEAALEERKAQKVAERAAEQEKLDREQEFESNVTSADADADAPLEMISPAEGVLSPPEEVSAPSTLSQEERTPVNMKEQQEISSREPTPVMSNIPMTESSDEPVLFMHPEEPGQELFTDSPLKPKPQTPEAGIESQTQPSEPAASECLQSEPPVDVLGTTTEPSPEAPESALRNEQPQVKAVQELEDSWNEDEHRDEHVEKSPDETFVAPLVAGAAIAAAAASGEEEKQQQPVNAPHQTPTFSEASAEEPPSREVPFREPSNQSVDPPGEDYDNDYYGQHQEPGYDQYETEEVPNAEETSEEKSDSSGEVIEYEEEVITDEEPPTVYDQKGLEPEAGEPEMPLIPAGTAAAASPDHFAASGGDIEQGRKEAEMPLDPDHAMGPDAENKDCKGGFPREGSSHRRKLTKLKIILIVLAIIVIIVLVITLPLTLIDRSASASPSPNPTPPPRTPSPETEQPVQPPSRPVTTPPTPPPETAAPTPPGLEYVLTGGPITGSLGSMLGSAASLYDDIAVAGSPGTSLGSITGFVGSNGEWKQIEQILEGEQVDGLFGIAVSIWGNGMLVGAPGVNALGTTQSTGAAYYYQFDHSSSTFSQLGTTLRGTENIEAFEEEFGASVARSGILRVVVGAPKRREGDGGVYAFDLAQEGDNFVWKMMTPEPISQINSQEELGSEVDISVDGQLIVAGAPAFLYGQGSFSIYRWNQVNAEWLKIMSDSGKAPNENFGSSVIFLTDDGSIVAVGGPGAFSTVDPLGLSGLQYTASGGVVRVYRKVEGSMDYEQLGPDLEGEPGEGIGAHGTVQGSIKFGRIISLIVGTANGRVKRFEYDAGANKWRQPYKTIETGTSNAVTSVAASDDFESFIVGVADMNTVAVYNTEASLPEPVDPPVVDPESEPLIDTMNPSSSSPATPVPASPSPAPGVTNAPSRAPETTLPLTVPPTSVLIETPEPSAATPETTLPPTVPPMTPSPQTNLPVEPATNAPTESGAGWTAVGGPFLGSAASSSLGESVAIIPSLLAASARSETGLVKTYELVNNQWIFLDDIEGSQSEGLFGNSVDINPIDRGILIGAPGTLAEGTSVITGAAHYYTREDGAWRELGPTIRGDITAFAANEYFGYSVSTSTDVIAIGAPFNNDEAALRRGKVYTFSYNPTSGAWLPLGLGIGGTVVGDQASDLLGSSCDISADGKTLIAGAPGANAGAGTAHVYQWRALHWMRVFSFGDATAGESFGTSVTILSDDGSIVAGGGVGYAGEKGIIRVFERQQDLSYSLLGEAIIGLDGEALGAESSISGSVEQGVPVLLAGAKTGEVKTLAFNSVQNKWAETVPAVDTGSATPSISGSVSIGSFASGLNNEVTVYGVNGL